MRFGTGNVDWGHHNGDNSQGGNGDRNDYRNLHNGNDGTDWRLLKKLQYTVAASTFSVVAFIGLFCTCLWVVCCRPKRQGRIRGRQWTVNNSFAVPGQPGHVIHHPMHHQGLNPYVINPGYYSDANLNSLNTSNGLYHPSAADILGGTKDEKPPPDSTYRPFFAKVEWEPPGPPTYQSLGFDNPTYVTNVEQNKSVYTSSDNSNRNELIKETVPVGVLANPDPSKMPQTQQPVAATAAANSCGENSDRQKLHDSSSESQSGPDKAEPSSTAPSESLISIESKDHGATLYPDGIKDKSSSSPGGEASGGSAGGLEPNSRMEELDPPPFNPSYLFGSDRASAYYTK